MKILACIILLATINVLSFGQDDQNRSQGDIERSEDCLDSLEIPSAFTPNSDGINDAFRIHFPCEPDEFKISIFNRWGNEVFTSDRHDFEWYGTGSQDDVDLPDGVYVYVMNYVYLENEITYSGNVSIMR